MKDRAEPRRILVTGAGGFVGKALALGFADLGWQVVGLDRAFDDDREHCGVLQVTAELADGVPPSVPEVDVVVHAAWVTTDADTLGITPAEYLDVNTRPLVAVLEYAARSSPTAFVFVSSSGVFAPTDGTEGLTDADRPRGTSLYAEGKRTGELQVAAALGPHVAIHIVRLGYLFGPDEIARPSRTGVSLVAGWLAAARDGQPLAVRSDDPLRDWTFTSDLAGALERVVDGPPAGHPVHLTSSHVISDRAFATLIASEVSGTEPVAEVVAVPAPGRVKPPMVPSDIPALRDFDWTDPSTGLRALLAGEVTA